MSGAWGDETDLLWQTVEVIKNEIVSENVSCDSVGGVIVKEELKTGGAFCEVGDVTDINSGGREGTDVGVSCCLTQSVPQWHHVGEDIKNKMVSEDVSNDIHCSIKQNDGNTVKQELETETSPSCEDCDVTHSNSTNNTAKGVISTVGVISSWKNYQLTQPVPQLGLSIQDIQNVDGYTAKHNKLECSDVTDINNGVREDNTVCLGSDLFLCGVCNYVAVKASEVKEHKLAHSDLKRGCLHCDYKCNHTSHLKVHMRTRKPHACDMCEFRGSCVSELMAHLRTHSGERPFACDVCGNSFRSSSTLKGDIRTHTGEKRFSCHLCDYRTTQGGNLKCHMKKHTRENPYFCDFCDYKFAAAADLKKHMRIHTGEEPYSCDFCNFTCKRNDDLKKHLMQHTGEKLSCDLCEYTCYVRAVMRRHKRIHTGEKPFACATCEFRCNDPCSLRRHRQIHTGYKPFSCDSCDYKCYQNSDLRKHVARRHAEPVLTDMVVILSSDKPYGCAACEFTCEDQPAMSRHIKKHTEEKRFTCDLITNALKIVT